MQVLLRQRGVGAWRPCERLPRAAVVTGGASTGNHEVGVFVVSEEGALQVAEFLASDSSVSHGVTVATGPDTRPPGGPGSGCARMASKAVNKRGRRPGIAPSDQ